MNNNVQRVRNNTIKILIVGAGPCGLAALKEMREAAFDAVAVDAQSTFGVFVPDSGVTFEGLHRVLLHVLTRGLRTSVPAPSLPQEGRHAA